MVSLVKKDNMKNTLFALFALSAENLLASSTPVGFIDDYDLALERAKTEKKYIVADFSGSDWCFWCQRLDKEVFQQEAFISVATNKYVLLMIDSPRDKSILSEKAKTQNKALVRRYKVNGFPTVLLLNDEGKIVGETGFVGGGPENYLKHLEEKVAAIPAYLNYVKPLVKRINGFYRHYSEEMTKAMATVQGKDKSEAEAVERETTLKLVAEFLAIIAEERAKEVPDVAKLECEKILREAESGAVKLAAKFAP